MPYLNIPKPAVGDPITKAYLDSLVDNLIDLNNRLKTVTGGYRVQNGSFEDDIDADGIPDGWTRTLFNGGSLTILATDQGHANKSIRFTSIGGAGNGGGYVDSTDYIECSPQIPLLLTWQHKSSIATIRNKVEFFWYSVDGAGTKTFISSTTIYDNSTTNPTSWQQAKAGATPPATARYLKIRLVGCDSSNATAGSAFFDDVSLQAALFTKETVIDSIAATKWKCPAGVTLARVRVWGGGGGGTVNAGGGIGGGAGSFSESYVSVVPGTEYDVEAGAGGAGYSGGGSGAGGNGQASHFGTTLVTANGGTTNGTGGAAGTGQVAVAGENGSGVAGGYPYYGGVPGRLAGKYATNYAGGGAGHSAGNASGAGGRGAVVINHN